jgi:hypothetical protein
LRPGAVRVAGLQSALLEPIDQVRHGQLLALRPGQPPFELIG